MKVYKGISELRNAIASIKKHNRLIGFIPTMGFLHEGHVSLIKRARLDTDYVVVSIFVNPVQFGPKEDFKQYPRDLTGDLKLCRAGRVDIVFAPEAKSIFPEDFVTYVNVEGLSDVLCGASRPGHFKGVATIVAKLFNIVKPDIAYFGQKDAQQAVVVERMVRDLNMPLRIKVMPTVREKDGLAMSSRNTYLNLEERKEALSLYKSLKLAEALYKKGERNSGRIIARMRSLIRRHRGVNIDYISIVDIKTLKRIDRISQKALIAVAAWVGKTRLIDNIVLNKPHTKF